MIAAVIAVVFAISIRAYAQHPDAGTAAFPFLNMEYEARAVGMGGASAAVPNDIYGVLANPAAMGFVNNRSRAAAGYRQVFMDIWGGPLGLALPIKGGTFALNLITLSAGGFDIIDEDGNTTGDRARSSYTALGGSYARVIYDNLSAGGTIKGVYHYIGAGGESYSADGFAADIGVQYRFDGDRLIYGLTLRNVGVVRSGYYDEFNEYPMPTALEIGVSYVPRHIRSLRMALDVNKVRGDYLNFEPALEYSLLAGVLFLRGGYAFSYMDLEKTLEVMQGDRDETYQKSSVNTLSLGLGIATIMDGTDIKLDAAVQFYADISEPALVLSVSIGF